jgi:hypothetical protein
MTRIHTNEERTLAQNSAGSDERKFHSVPAPPGWDWRMRKPRISILKGLQRIARGRGAAATTTPGLDVLWIRTLKGVPETPGPPGPADHRKSPEILTTHIRNLQAPGCFPDPNKFSQPCEAPPKPPIPLTSNKFGAFILPETALAIPDLADMPLG